MSDLPIRMAMDLEHRVIEAAKAAHRDATSSDMTFEQHLAEQARLMVHERDGMLFWIGVRNGVWAFDVWHEQDECPHGDPT